MANKNALLGGSRTQRKGMFDIDYLYSITFST